MQPATRKKLFFGILIATMLILIAVGMVLTFAQGLDRRKIFVDLPAYWAVFPFTLPFPIFVGMEYFLSGKFQDEGFLFGYRSQSHNKVVSATFFVALISLVGGATAAFTLTSALPIAWVCFFESLISALPLLFYLIYTLIRLIKENASISQYLHIGAYLGVLLLLEFATLLLSLHLHSGYLLLYAGLPLLCIAMAVIAPESSSLSHESETAE